MASNCKTLNTKVMRIDDSFNLDMWKAQFGSRSEEIWPPKYLLRRQVPNQTDYILRLFWGSYLRFQGNQWIPNLEIICGTQPGHRICIIWCPKVGDMAPTREDCESGKSGRYWGYGNQVPFSPKEDLVQGRLEHAPRLPKGINTTPWAP
jgi:hypothetical protein